jgi:hypothetical protein
MTCVQTQPCVSPQQDTKAGFDPQKLTRTKATARYIVFIFLFVFCVALSGKARIHVVWSSVSFYTASGPPSHISGLPQSLGQDPQENFTCASHVAASDQVITPMRDIIPSSTASSGS